MVHKFSGPAEMNLVRKQHIAYFAATLAATVLSYFFLDIPLTYYCRNLDRFILDKAEVVTEFGKSTAYILISLLFFVYFKFFNPKEVPANRAIFVFFAVALSGILVNILKWIAGRYRPIVFLEEGLFGFSFFGIGYEFTSFPSGHATAVFSLAYALSIFYPKYRVLFFVIAAVVASSRVILTSHYLSDVIFGAFFGIAFVYLLKEIFDWRGWRLVQDNPRES